MTKNPDNHDTRSVYLEMLVPVLAFGSTIIGIALWELAGMRFEIQYAAAGAFAASCLLAYLAWIRPRKDIVSLSTPIYGFLFLVSPIDYYSGIILQLFYNVGLTILVIRLHFRFGRSAPDAGTDLADGLLREYVGSTRDAFAALDPAAGHTAAMAFITFSEGDYRKAADVSHTGSCQDGTPTSVVRAFTILRQHAELLDRCLPRPVTWLKFLPEDADLIAKPLPGSKNPDREFETEMDNALLLLFSAAWHASGADRPALLVSQPFAKKLLES